MIVSGGWLIEIDQLCKNRTMSYCEILFYVTNIAISDPLLWSCKTPFDFIFHSFFYIFTAQGFVLKNAHNNQSIRGKEIQLNLCVYIFVYIYVVAKSEGSRKDLNKLHWHTLHIKISLIINPSGYETYQQ